MRGLMFGLGVVVLMVAGFLLIKGPSPAIIVAPEHIFDIGPIEVTNTMFTSWLVVGLLIIVSFVAGRGVSLIPSGFSGAVEATVVAFYDMVVGVVGEENGRRFFPLVGTIFFFVLASNYFGLLPGNFNIGKPEPGHGDKQVVFEQSTFLGLDVAVIPNDPRECEGAECPHAEEGDAHGADADHAESTDHADTGTADTADTDTADTDTADAEDDHAVAATTIDGGGDDHGDAVETIDLEEEEFTGLLAPYLRSVNTDVNAPLAIAIFSFIFVEFWGLQTLGVGYLGKFFAFGKLLRGNPLGIIDAFVGILELVSEFSRIISFTFRLFGNIFAGEVLLLMMSFLVPLVLVDIFYGLELFVGLIQAFVFAMLTLVFAQTAVSHHGDDHHDESAAHE